MPVRDFDPRDGQAFQGDIAIVPIPPSITVAQVEEIAPIDGRLIIQEGEASGHHHAIRLPGQVEIARFRDDGSGSGGGELRDARGDARENKPKRPRVRAIVAHILGRATSPRAQAAARLYRDHRAVRALFAAGILTRTDLAIGCLVVEGGDVVIGHEEHDGIRLPPGRYYIGRQIESAGADARIVAD